MRNTLLAALALYSCCGCLALPGRRLLQQAAGSIVAVGANGRMEVLSGTVPGQTAPAVQAAGAVQANQYAVLTPVTEPAPYEAIPGIAATRGFTGFFQGVTYQVNGSNYVQHVIGQGLDFQVLTVQRDSTTTDFAQIATGDIGYAYVRGLKCTGSGEGLFLLQPAQVGTDLSVALNPPGAFCIKFKVTDADTFIDTFAVAANFSTLLCPGKFETQQSITSAAAPVFGYNVFKRRGSASFPDC